MIILRNLAFIGALVCALFCLAPAFADDDPLAFARAGMDNHTVIRGGSARAKSAHTGEPMRLSGARMLDEARRYVGSGKVTRAPGPWCRDFVNLVARRAGYHLANNSRRAIDATKLGQHVSTPHPGDLVVYRHHVAIFAGVTNGRLNLLGGNQGKRVKYSAFSTRGVVAYVRL